MSWPGSAPCWRGQHPLWTTVWPENSSKLCREPFYFNFHTGRCCACPVHVIPMYASCALPSVVAVHHGLLVFGVTSMVWFVCADVRIMANGMARHNCIQSLLSQREVHSSSVCGGL